jgi:hypothetical protein
MNLWNNTIKAFLESLTTKTHIDMKTTILLMFSFIFITGSLFGQKDTIIYIDSDNKHFFPITNPNSPRFKKPSLKSPNKPYSPTMRNLDRFELYQDSSSIKYDTIRLSTEYSVSKKFPGASRFYAKRPDLVSSHNEKSFIIKPDTTIKYYLIIMDPVLHAIRR